MYVNHPSILTNYILLVNDVEVVLNYEVTLTQPVDDFVLVMFNEGYEFSRYTAMNFVF